MKSLFLMMTLILSIQSVFAGVNLKNGNFYISYTDIIVPGGGNDLRITRTYNSQSPKKGWFGLGWGSDYETFLVVSADGSVIIHENGSGAKTRFTPKNTIDPKAAAKKIVDHIRKKTNLAGKEAKKLEERLASDQEVRQGYARKYGISAKLANGTILYSNTRGLQEVHKVKDGYIRKYNEGKSERFNEKGQLLKISDKNGYYIEFNYKKGKLVSIKDSQAKQLFFDWYPNNQVRAIWSVDKNKVTYSFKGGDLIETTDVSKNTYKYEYNSDHFLNKITYGDGSSMEIGYDPKTRFASSVKSRDGEVVKYKYDSNPKNPDYHYWTVVEKKSPQGKKTENRYEYEIKVRPDGSQYTYRIETVVNGIKTETVYSECCGLPLRITRGKHTTTFEYNKDGLLTKKTSTKGDYVELEYDKKHKKISRVVNSKGWTNFTYDKKGNLSKAINNGGQSVLLIYDRKGRITKMVDFHKKTKDKRTLSFKYNALGKPVEIAMDKIGKINVAYDNYGEIKKVESKAGHKMALQVTQAFQSLLSIVKPAGVNLNM